MAQNITLMGASYSDVPAVTLPKTGGGTATFTDTSDANAEASDISSGKTAYVDGVKITGTGSGGGGGASNVVTGTFTGTTTGAVMDVNLDYSGNGYPIAAMAYPEEGPYNSDGTYYNLIQQYATQTITIVKNYPNIPATYNGTGSANSVYYLVAYKNSTNSAKSYGRASGPVAAYSQSNASASSSAHFSFKSATTLSVFIASTSYGFAANIPYRYWVIYSE